VFEARRSGDDMAPRKRAAFTLSGRSSDDEGDDGSSRSMPMDAGAILDDQGSMVQADPNPQKSLTLFRAEQAQVIEDLKQLSDQSSMLWRISSLILEAICVAV
jgi:hypothetical protein